MIKESTARAALRAVQESESHETRDQAYGQMAKILQELYKNTKKPKKQRSVNDLQDPFRDIVLELNNTFYEQYEGLIIFYAKKFNTVVPEVINQSVINILENLTDYKPEKCTFNTFIMLNVKASINMYYSFKYNRTLYENALCNKFSSYLRESQKDPDDITPQELMKRYKIGEIRAKRMIELQTTYNNIINECEDSENPEEIILRNEEIREAQEKISRIFKHLNDDQRITLYLTEGLQIKPLLLDQMGFPDTLKTKIKKTREIRSTAMAKARHYAVII